MKRRDFIQHTALSSLSLLGTQQTAMEEMEAVKSKLLKTDTHVHLFDLENIKYPWLINAPTINRDFSLEDYRQATRKSGIGKIIFMESGAAPEFALAEAQRVAAVAKEDSRLVGIIAQLDMLSDLEQSPTYAGLKSLQLLKGIRGKFKGDSAQFMKNLKALGSDHLTYDLLLSHRQLASGATVIKQSPKTQFILDHIGNPDIKLGEMEPWKQGIRMLSELPNVSCKISGIISRMGEQWSLELMKPYVNHVIESFGINRLVYGGDWPVVLLGGSYQSWSSAFETLMTDFSLEEKANIYFKNADRIYNIG